MKTVRFREHIINRQDVINALNVFDSEHRGDDDYNNWTDNRSYIYSLVFDNKLYPPKQLIRIITGIDQGFSGGEDSNRVFEQLGFTVTTIHVGKRLVSAGNTQNNLQLYAEYSREDVHRIFSPHTRFTPQAGTWGLQGIVPIADRPKDYVFFVTFGQEQGNHIFDESITEDGVLAWQSQPSQTLNHSQIQDFINHDELSNSIYLFLRTNREVNYTYLGQLQYISHDTEREQPVWFQWQILDWNIPEDVLEQMGLTLEQVSIPKNNPDALIQTAPPTPSNRQGTDSTTFRTYKSSDRSKKEQKNRNLGLAGELLVLEEEKRTLIEADRHDLAEKIVHTSVIEGDGAGYDIFSYTVQGTIKHIEVKTTTGDRKTPFYISSNEVAFSEQNPKTFYLVRVYEYEFKTNSGKYYEIVGDVTQELELRPTNYRAIPA